jgi:hypothetical protein
MAIPGTYQARLSIGDAWSRTTEFEVKMDPRVAEDGVTQQDLVAQRDVAVRVRDLMSEARRTTHRIQTVSEELTRRLAGASTSDARRMRSGQEKLEALRLRLVNADQRYPQQVLLSQIQYLYSMLNRADQAPGTDAYVRLDELTAEVDTINGDLRRVMERDLAGLGIETGERGAR